MAKFRFDLEVGFLYRKQVRIELERSKDKLEYLYPGSSMSIREEKDFKVIREDKGNTHKYLIYDQNGNMVFPNTVIKGELSENAK